jgi:hypothetical protein
MEDFKHTYSERTQFLEKLQEGDLLYAETHVNGSRNLYELSFIGKLKSNGRHIVVARVLRKRKNKHQLCDKTHNQILGFQYYTCYTWGIKKGDTHPRKHKLKL